jgi:hypothetical protein
MANKRQAKKAARKKTALKKSRRHAAAQPSLALQAVPQEVDSGPGTPITPIAGGTPSSKEATTGCASGSGTPPTPID